MSGTRNTEVNEAVPKNRRRTPEELAAYHRAQAQANDARFAAQVDVRVAQAKTLLRKIDSLSNELPASYQGEIVTARDAIFAVHKRLIGEALKGNDPEDAE